MAVREGRDVIIIDACRDNIPKVQFASKALPHPRTVVNSKGKVYEVDEFSIAFTSYVIFRE